MVTLPRSVYRANRRTGFTPVALLAACATGFAYVADPAACALSLGLAAGATFVARRRARSELRLRASGIAMRYGVLRPRVRRLRWREVASVLATPRWTPSGSLWIRAKHAPGWMGPVGHLRGHRKLARHIIRTSRERHRP